MPEIKTKDLIKGSVKTLDRSNIVSQKIKQNLVSVKEKSEQSTNAVENNAEEYASNKFESAKEEVVYKGIKEFDKSGRKSVSQTRDNINKAKNAADNFKHKKMVENLKNSRIKTKQIYKKAAEESKVTKNIQYSIKNKKNVVKGVKSTVDTAGKSVKSIKNAKITARGFKNAANAVKTSGAAAQKSFNAAKLVAKTTAASAKATGKILLSTIKSVILATKVLISAIIAGGWIAVMIIIVICFAMMICGSSYGIFFSNEESKTGQTIQTVIAEIDEEYQYKIDEIVENVPHNDLKIIGETAMWKEMLAVYAVKVNTDSDNPLEVATMDDTKKQFLKDIFWDINQIEYETEIYYETVIEETVDDEGNIIENEIQIEKTRLIITIDSLALEEISSNYSFNEQQKILLTDLLKDENNALWKIVLEEYILNEISKLTKYST